MNKDVNLVEPIGEDFAEDSQCTFVNLVAGSEMKCKIGENLVGEQNKTLSQEKCAMKQSCGEQYRLKTINNGFEWKEIIKWDKQITYVWLHFVRNATTFYDAKSKCESDFGGVLFSKMKNDYWFILTLRYRMQGQAAWLGITDVESEGTYLDVTGRQVDSSTFLWEPNFPRDEADDFVWYNFYRFARQPTGEESIQFYRVNEPSENKFYYMCDKDI